MSVDRKLTEEESFFRFQRCFFGAWRAETGKKRPGDVAGWRAFVDRAAAWIRPRMLDLASERWR